MNLNPIWKEILQEIFKDKPAMLVEFLNNSKLESYSSQTKTLKLIVKKMYLEKIMIDANDKIKTLFEKTTKKPVNNLFINNKQIEIKFVKKLDPVANRDESKSIKSKPISYLSLEQTFNDEVFIKERDLADTEKIKIQNLDFFNKELNKTKTLIYKKSNSDYQRCFKYSLLFIWTLVVPMILLPLGINKKLKMNKLVKDIRELILNKYRPSNMYSKTFIKNIVK